MVHVVMARDSVAVTVVQPREHVAPHVPPDASQERRPDPSSASSWRACVAKSSRRMPAVGASRWTARRSRPDLSQSRRFGGCGVGRRTTLYVLGDEKPAAGTASSGTGARPPRLAMRSNASSLSQSAPRRRASSPARRTKRGPSSVSARQHRLKAPPPTGTNGASAIWRPSGCARSSARTRASCGSRVHSQAAAAPG